MTIATQQLRRGEEESKPSPPPRGDVPGFIYLARMIQLCFFPVLTVVLGSFALLCVSQVREALLAFGDRPYFVSQAVAFELAVLAWMLSAWYVARLLVGKRFHPDLVGRCRSPWFARAVARWLPRTLALLAGIPVVLWIAFELEPAWVGETLVVANMLVFGLVVFRRPLSALAGHRWVDAWTRQSDEQFERFETIGPSGWVFILLLALLSAGLWIALPLGMERVARYVGSPALLLFALMSWTIFGGFVLTYLPKAHGWPGMTWIPLLAALCFYPLNENHLVTAAAHSLPNAPRQRLRDEFRSWLKARRDPTGPVIFVATAGGASRAAYWTTSALGKLEDEARQHHQMFAANLFVISGVSGGSLGAATFVAALDESRRADPAGPCGSVRALGERFTGRDDLATVLGMLLFPDLLQRFLPFHLHWWDRSRGLEEVWERDWDRVTARCGPGARQMNPWRQPFTRLHERARRDGWLPALALNATALGSGRPVLQADFTMQRTDAFDLFDPRLAVGPITLAQAVHNSARFPYVSPPGVVRLAGPGPGQQGAVWDRIGDGAYVESSGARMLTEIIGELRRAGLIRVPNSGAQGGDAEAVARGEYITTDQVRVLILDGTPTAAAGDSAGWLCDRNATASANGIRAEVPQNAVKPGDWWRPPVPEVTAPLVGLVRTRDGRNVSSQVDLLRLAGGCTDRFAELRLPRPADPDDVPSMSWMLRARSRSEMREALDDSKVSDGGSAALLRENLDRVRSWLVDDRTTPVTAHR